MSDAENDKSIAGLMVSAAWRSSGKTMVSIGIARAAQRRQLTLQTFKKGPDYIDPLWLASASGVPCYNLDPYLQGDAEIRATFARNAEGKALALIEGTMGLHDGLASDGSDSNASLAKMLNSGVLLVVDCRGMHRTVAALINGILQFDPQVQFAGVILNRIRSDRHAGKIRRALIDHTDVALLGCIADDSRLHIDERELGLVPAPEHGGLAQTIDTVADTVQASCDLDALFTLPCVMTAANAVLPKTHLCHLGGERKSPATLKIGLCRDAAFHFYYQDDLDVLRQRGVELVEMSPLVDQFPKGLDGLLIGGGFPERHAGALSVNKPFRQDLRKAVADGLIVHAECAGLMYLCRSLQVNGVVYPMTGVIAADVSMRKAPLGRGYVKLVRHHNGSGNQRDVDSVEEPPEIAANNEQNSPLISAHEFHHSEIAFDDPPDFTYGVKRGYGIDGSNDGVRVNGVIASYAHFRHTVATPWIDWFLQRIADVGTTNRQR